MRQERSGIHSGRRSNDSRKIVPLPKRGLAKSSAVAVEVRVGRQVNPARRRLQFSETRMRRRRRKMKGAANRVRSLSLEHRGRLGPDWGQAESHSHRRSQRRIGCVRTRSCDGIRRC